MNRTSLVSFALAIPLASAACGSDDDGDGGGTVEGTNYRYVVSKLDSKETNRLDIDGDGKTDNKLGALVGLLTAAGFTVQETVDEAVNTGTAVLLADLQTTSFTAAANSGFSIYLGDSATVAPKPCTDPTVLTTCGQHLKGTGTFSVAASAPRDTLLKGSIASGTMKGGPGKIAIQIALTGAPITVNLVSARVQLSEASADAIGKGLLGGGVTQDELNNNLFPAIQGQIKAVIDRDCGPENVRAQVPVPGSSPPVTACGRSDTMALCVATGAAVLAPSAGFDTARDCKVTIEEIKAQPILANGLKPDIKIDGQDAISVVLGFTAVKAVFTP